MITQPISGSNFYYINPNAGTILTQGNTSTGKFHGFVAMSNVSSVTTTIATGSSSTTITTMVNVVSMSFDNGTSVSGSFFFAPGSNVDLSLTSITLSGSSAPILLKS